MKNWSPDQAALFWGYVYEKIVHLQQEITLLKAHFEKYHKDTVEMVKEELEKKTNVK